MLNITPISARARTYYITMSSATAYYTERSEAPAYWLGGGAPVLGLSGPVLEEHCALVFAGRSPDGQLLRQNADGEKRMRKDGTPYKARVAWDLTLLAPGDLNALYGAGDDRIRSNVIASQSVAVGATVDYIERRYLRVRSGHAGARQLPAKALAIGVPHLTNRNGEALIHTHVVLTNQGLANDGRWRAIESRPLYRAQHDINAFYMAALRRELENRLGIRTTTEREWFQIQGMRRDIVEALTGSRAREVLAAAKSDSPRAREIAALATRRPKGELPPLDQLKALWRAKAQAMGFDIAQLSSHPQREKELSITAQARSARDDHRAQVVDASVGQSLRAMQKEWLEERKDGSTNLSFYAWVIREALPRAAALHAEFSSAEPFQTLLRKSVHHKWHIVGRARAMSRSVIARVGFPVRLYSGIDPKSDTFRLFRLQWLIERHYGRCNQSFSDWLRGAVVRPKDPRREAPRRRVGIAKEAFSADEIRAARHIFVGGFTKLRSVHIPTQSSARRVVLAAAERVNAIAGRLLFPSTRRLLVVSPTPETFRGAEGPGTRVWSMRFFLDHAVRPRTHLETLQAMTGNDSRWKPPQFRTLGGFLDFASRVKGSPRVRLRPGTMVVLHHAEVLTVEEREQLVEAARRSRWKFTVLHEAPQQVAREPLRKPGSPDPAPQHKRGR